MSNPAALRARCGALAIAGLVALSGCTDETSPSPSPSSSANPTASAPANPSEEPSAPAGRPLEFVEGGSAEDNLPYFRFTLQQLVDDTGSRPPGRAILEAAVEAGFDGDAMELTADVTPLGNATDAVTLAVRIRDDCMIAEVRGSSVSTVVAPVLGTGRCLVGATVSLD